MTDKQLDEKLISAFDSLRADSSVKARIRKGLTGDSMEKKNITVTNTENITKDERTEKTEKITVKRRGRVAAAAVAAVLLAGGGGILLKNGFDKVEPPSANETSMDTGGSVPEGFIGWFDPAGYTVFDKFGPESDIWRLPDGRFLVMQYGNLNGVADEYYKGLDGMEYHYFIYDGSANSVVGTELTSEDWRIRVYDDCFALWHADYGEMNDMGFCKSMSYTGTVYDFDMNPIKSDINIEADGHIVGDPMLTPDKTIFYTVATYSEDNACTITTYDENGEHFPPIDFADYSIGGGMSRDGSFIYTSFKEEDHTAIWVDMPNDDHGMNISLDGEAYPMIFDIGEYICYFTMDTPSAQTELHKYDTTEFKESEIFTLDTAEGKLGGYYVSESGNYLFLCTNDYGDVNSSAVRVYDTRNGFELIHEERVPGLNLGIDENGANVLVDEESGDVNIGGFFDGMTEPSPRQKNNLTFNLYGEEYGNFGIGVYQGDPDDGDTAVSVSGINEPYYGFYPEGETIIEKFGDLAEIHKITDDRYVIESAIPDGDWFIFEYAVYDVPTNSIVKLITSDVYNDIAILDNGFAIYNSNWEEAEPVEAQVYDTNGDLTLTYTFLMENDAQKLGSRISSKHDLYFSHDGTAMYVPVREELSSTKYKTKLYRAAPDVFSVSYGCINGDGWENRDIFDMAVSEDGNTLAYLYTDDGKSIRLGITDSGSYRTDAPAEDERVINDAIATAQWDGRHFLFARGSDFFLISDESGELTIARAAEDGYTAKNYIIPQKGSYDYCLSETGRYILLTSTATDSSNIFVYEITDDGLTLVNDLPVEGSSICINYDGRNTFFDESSGDLCLKRFRGGDTIVLTDNVFGSDYGNFNWNTAVSVEGDYPQEFTTSTTVTADLPDIYDATDAQNEADVLNTEMTLTVEYDMVYIVSDPAVIESVKQWYRDFLAANYEPAQYPDTYTEMAYSQRKISFYDDNGKRVTIETPENTIFDVCVNGVNYNDIEMKVIHNLWWDTPIGIDETYP